MRTTKKAWNSSKKTIQNERKKEKSVGLRHNDVGNSEKAKMLVELTKVHKLLTKKDKEQGHGTSFFQKVTTLVEYSARKLTVIKINGSIHDARNRVWIRKTIRESQMLVCSAC